MQGMGKLTEIEIFECLSVNFRLAAEHCEDLARLPRKGPTYILLRKELRLLEGACRQAAQWRDDARWLQIGLYMAETHKRAGDWLRGVKQPAGGYRPIPEGQRHPMFLKLADCLRAGERRAESLRIARTGRRGTILPKPLAGPHRETRPVGWTKAASGLLVPTAA